MAVAVLLALSVVAQEPVCEDPKVLSVTESEESIPPWLPAHYVNVTHSHASYLIFRWQGGEEVWNRMTNPVKWKISKGCLMAPAPLEVEARGCGAPDKKTVMIAAPDFQPTVKAVLAPPGWDQRTVRIDWTAPNSVWRRMRAILLPAGEVLMDRSDFGTLAYGMVGLSTFSHHEGTLLVKMTNCEIPAQSPVALQQNDCGEDCNHKCSGLPECVGAPVNTFTGNMRYEDVDPVPANGFMPFRRTYLSRTELGGFFGRRWFSMFDAALHVFDDDVDGARYVSVVREDHGLMHFERHGSTYHQFGPGGPHDGHLEHRADGSWMQTDGGGDLARIFNAEGLPIAFRDVASGREVRLTWNAGLPVRIDDSWGNWALDVTTDPATRLITSLNVTGRPDLAWNYIYDSHLIRVSTPSGTWRSYEYGDAQTPADRWLKVARDGAGSIIESHAYPGSGRALNSYGPGGEIDSIGIMEPGRTADEYASTVRYKNGRVETHYRRWVAGAWRTVEVDGGCATCGSRVSAVAYDTNGNVGRAQGPDGYVTTSTFDASGHNLVSTRSAMRPANCDPATAADLCRLSTDSLATVDLVATTATLETTHEYADGNWPHSATTTLTTSVVDPAQTRRETTTYDAATGQALTHTVNGWTGSPAHQETRVTTVTLYDGTEGAAFTPGGAFSSAWLTLPQPRMRKSIDGPRSDVADVSRFVYYPIDDAIPAAWRGRLAATRNALGHITRFEDYDVFGSAARTIDSNGVVTRNTYDGVGRLLTTTLEGVTGCDTTADPLCNTDAISSRTYAGAGPLLTASQPRGGVTKYEYDHRGRPLTISRGPSQPDLRERIEYEYDPANAKKSVERTLAREGSAWVEKRRLSFTYDIFEQLQQVNTPDGASTSYAYDAAGRMSAVRDENHTSPNTAYAYEPGGRLRSVTQTLASATSGSVTTSYTYDLHGNLTSVTDPNGNVTTYQYDDFGQMQKQVSPVSRTTRYAYDSAGNLTETTDANGATMIRTYDVLGRVLTSVSSRVGSSAQTVQWTYDAGTFGIGRLSSMTDPSGTTQYGYDRAGRLAAETRSIGGVTYTTTYRYDLDGNRTSITYPSNRVAEYSFDHAGRPVALTLNGAAVVTGAAYAPFGPMTHVASANGTTRTMTYDTRYRPQTNVLTGPAGPIASYTYGYDPVGNVTSIHDAIDAGYNRDFAYDDLNRLTVANTGAALWGNGSYSYDAMGNLMSSMLGARTASFDYAGTTPKIVSSTENGVTRSVTYDAAGNERVVGAEAYDYSPRNHLAAGESSSYVYDGRGVRTIALHPPELDTLTAAPATLYNGQSGVGTVTLDQPAGAGGAVVTLGSSSSALTVPVSVTVAEAATQAAFTYTVGVTAPAGVATITATHRSTRTAAVTIIAGPPLASIAVTPASVFGSESAVATITLSAPAPPGGATVQLGASSGSVSLPATVTIAAGETAATVSVGTAVVSSTTVVVLTAAYGASLVSTSLELLPATLVSLSISPSSVMGGHLAGGTVTLSAPAPAGGVTVTLASAAPAIAAVPASVVVPAGQTTRTFSITTTAQNAQADVTITATYNGNSRTAALNVTQCVPVFAAPPLIPAGETIWADDALIAGAAFSGWIGWDTSQYASGNASLVHADGGAMAQSSSITNLNQPLAIGESAVVYFRVNECALPREIKITWYASDGYWKSAYWGEALMGGEGLSMGAVPTTGDWIRVEIPFSQLAMEGKTLGTIALAHHGGQVFFDRIGKGGTACTETTETAPTIPAGETIWADDALIAGAAFSGWIGWDASQHASGNASLVHAYGGATAQSSSITNLNQPLAIGESAVVYFRVNECALPREIKITWYASDGYWKSAYWGEALMGGEGLSMGSVPTTGDWIRVEIPFSQLAMEGKTLGTIALAHHGGQVFFDRIGKGGTACRETTEPAPTIPAGETIWADDALIAGAAISGWAHWDTSQHASGNASLTHAYAGGTAQGSSITNLNQPVHIGESAVVYFRVSECAIPREIKVGWYATDGYWKSAYWGERLMGGEGLSMGAVPTIGDWVRVEIPFSQLAMEGKTLGIVALEHHSGQVWFDRIGKTAPVSPAVLTEFTGSHPSPQPPGTTITWTAQATGSVLPLEYQFERQDSSVWSIVQLYGAANAYTWTPVLADAGEHAVRVSVRNAGSAAPFEDVETLPMTIAETGGNLQAPPTSFLTVLLSRVRLALTTADHPPISMSVGMNPISQSVTAENHYLYTPELNLMVEATATNGQRTIEHEYLWFGGQPVAQVESRTGAIHYYFNDHLGTPVLTTDAAAVVDWRVERKPYGGTYAVRAGVARHQPLSLPGQEDSASEGSYNIFRWYRAGWGRYTQSDPIDLDGGINLFVYALGNPLALTDPLGLDTAGCDDVLGKLENPCEKECCAAHDKCFDNYNCSSGSWGDKPKCGCDQTPQCKKCNSDVVKCFSLCSLKAGIGSSKKPNYYCAKLHKYINIPKDFPSYDAAMKACAYDHAQDCKIPLSSAPPKKKPWYKKIF